MPALRRCATAALFVLLAACVTKTSSTSTADPAYLASQARGRIVVVAAPNLPYDERLAAETEMAALLAGRELRVLRAHDLLPRDRAPTPAEIDAAFARAQAEALLILRGRPAERNVTIAGMRYFPTQTYKTEQQIGNYVVTTTETRSGAGSGRYTYDAELVSFATGRPVWRAEIAAQGGDGAQFRDLAVAAAQEAVRRLLADKAL